MKKPISVKQLGAYLAREVQTDPFLRNILVVGEIVNLTKRKYVYFNLKEENESISCVYFNSEFDFEEGDKIVVQGSISLYLRDSRYQIRIDKASHLGQGDSSIQLEKLKKKLKDKGYFDLDRKKAIPSFPKKIGLITGFESAAYYDFIKVFLDNKYGIKIYYYPSLVQGQEAPFDISNGLEILDKKGLDLIVLSRGGGSKEDLQAFNSELVADTILNLKTPLITAIGHEIDTSIADLVGDLRLQTPTKAGEYIVESYIRYKEKIKLIKLRIDNSLLTLIQKNSYRLNILNKKISSFDPNKLINDYNKSISNNKLRIDSRLDYLINQYKNTMNTLAKSIDNSYNKLLIDNQIFIKDNNDKFVEFNNLLVNESYILEQKDIRYKVLIEERYGE